jgi:hypothetical protein
MLFVPGEGIQDWAYIARAQSLSSAVIQGFHLETETYYGMRSRNPPSRPPPWDQD